MARSSWWPWFAAACVVALGAFGIVLSLVGHHGDSWWEIGLGSSAVLVSLVLGLLIAVRRPGNRMALPLYANALVIALAAVADSYAHYAVVESPDRYPAPSGRCSGTRTPGRCCSRR